ncbi:MAG: KGK domain-containing protein [Cyanobacteria bacterium J06649_11]
MNDKEFSIILDCDDDVVLFEKDTFKVARLKELMIREVKIKLKSLMQRCKYQALGQFMTDYFHEVIIGEESINFNYKKFETIRDCQIIQVNNKVWQKGKLNIEICISPNINKPDKVNLKFFPEQPTEPESPLNDIREMMQTN